MNNDLISREALLDELSREIDFERENNMPITAIEAFKIAIKRAKNLTTVDAEPVRHEGNTTFITTENLGDYADRIIVGQGTFCKVYYGDEPEKI